MSIIKANIAPNSGDVENITPVFITPISLRLNKKKSMEKPMLKAPADTKYGKADNEILNSSPSVKESKSRWFLLSGISKLL